MASLPKFLDGGGDAAVEIAWRDWSETPVGHMSEWPDVLKTTVAIMLRSGFPKAFVWRDGLTTFHNDAFREILGNKPPAIGVPFDDVWREAWSEIGPLAADALDGRPTFIENFPLMVDRSGSLEQAYFTFSYSPVANAEGQIVGFMDTVVETTQSVVEKRRSDVLNAELSHRIKNMLSVVNSIVSQTLKSAEAPAEVASSITARLQALASVQDVLRVGAKNEAGIGEIVAAALQPHDARDRIVVDGPNQNLDDAKVLALSLALNELATNAIKYGALSNSEGKVDLHWDFDGGGNLSLTWTERGGPPVKAPTKTGFGSKLIQRYVSGTFGGTAKIAYEPHGIVYQIRPH